MKKIMFDDRFGLTKAVLEGCKTMFRQKCGMTLHKLDENGEFVEIFAEDMMMKDNIAFFELYNSFYRVPTENQPRYKIGETVAVAQSYSDVYNKNKEWLTNQCAANEEPVEYRFNEQGWNNKTRTAAYYMPHQIRITDIKVERLQDISDDDCLREGVRNIGSMEGNAYVPYMTCPQLFDTPVEAFQVLIDKVSGKGTWESNPYVFVYEFELIKKGGAE